MRNRNELNAATHAALLAAAARLIESRQPANMATLRHQLTWSSNGPSLFLVRSKPGRPTVPDTLLGVRAL